MKVLTDTVCTELCIYVDMQLQLAKIKCILAEKMRKMVVESSEKKIN